MNKRRHKKVSIVGMGGKNKDYSAGTNVEDFPQQLELNLNFSVEEWRDAIYANIIVKCSNRRY